MYNDYVNRGHLDKKLDMIIGANKSNVNRKAMLNIFVWVVNFSAFLKQSSFVKI